MDHPEIVGTDISLDRKSIVFYVTPKFMGEFPRKMAGYPTETLVLKHYTPCDNTNRKLRFRPIVAGVSAGCMGISAGTIGSVVFDNSTNKAMILSNNHVFAAVSTSEQRRVSDGEPIVQPGKIDGGSIDDNIATLYRYIPLDLKGDNLVDAAVATLNSDAYDAIIGDHPGEMVVIKETAPVKYGMKVQKFGRTSGWTEGKITGVDSHIDVNMGKGRSPLWARFIDQISINLKGLPGDSGSIILDEDYRAVGLLAAGSEGIFGNTIIANKINNVASLLDFHFAYTP